MKLTNLQLKKIIKEEIVRLQENEDEADIESMKKLIVDFLREKGPSSYNRISHRLSPKPGPHRQLPELDAALVQLTDPDGENRVSSYYKSSYAGSIYYLVPEQQHMVPGADPQASFLQEQEGDEYVALEEQIISYLKEHGPSKVADIRRAGLPDPTHGGGWVTAFVNLRNAERTDFYQGSDDRIYWYLVPEHQHMVPGADPQATLFEEDEYEPPIVLAKELIVNYLKKHGPTERHEIRRGVTPEFPPEPPGELAIRGQAWSTIGVFNDAIRQLKNDDRRIAGEREYTSHRGEPSNRIILRFYLIPEHQPLMSGAEPQAALFQEVELFEEERPWTPSISKEQLLSVKMQIIYYLLAWGPKADKDVIRYITKQTRGGHWEHVSEDELRKSVFWAFSELKSEGKVAWRREQGSHGTMTNWWYLTPQHDDLLSTAGGQEEMFLQETEDTNKIAKAVIVNEQGEVLILKRSSYSKYAGTWDLPGGHIAAGEFAADAVRREVLEETNLEIVDPEELYIKDRVTYFKASLPQQEIRLSDEHTDYKYINSEELQEINIAEKYRNAIEYVL